MQLPGSLCHFRLHANAEPSVFASCFALFLLHLCRETESWDEKTRAAWVDYVCGFQEKESGLFRDSDTLSRVTDSDHNAEHMDRQLTGFCISALRALQAQPRYRLSYVVPWCDENYMRRWLTNLDWCRSSNSGNKAMFIAIMLVDELERGNEPAAKGLEAWFQWHDRHADPLTGYWGSTLDCRYFHGMIGFVHQALIYNYVGRRVQHVERVIDGTLQLQQPDGLFSPSLNGASCNDLDAIHPLCYFYHTNRYRRPEIRRALGKALPRLLANQIVTEVSVGPSVAASLFPIGSF